MGTNSSGDSKLSHSMAMVRERLHKLSRLKSQASIVIEDFVQGLRGHTSETKQAQGGHSSFTAGQALHQHPRPMETSPLSIPTDNLQYNQPPIPVRKAPDIIVVIDKDRCSSCGICVDICPVEVFTLEDLAVAESERCIGCCSCVNECPNQAISLVEPEVASG